MPSNGRPLEEEGMLAFKSIPFISFCTFCSLVFQSYLDVF
jgi:hypothetical protein